MDRLLMEQYFAGYQDKKLQVGSGGNVLEGWLNSDLHPCSRDKFHLNAVKPFPFRDDTFRLIFSEHMIEHVPNADGEFMLSECRRVLKPGGTIRISTPDLAFLMDLFREDKSQIQGKYIERFIQSACPRAHERFENYILNYFVREWGHSFIYDEPTLRKAMQRAGFVNIRRCRVSESQVEGLAGLENIGRLPTGFLELETLTLEGDKV